MRDNTLLARQLDTVIMDPAFSEHWQTEAFYDNNEQYFEELLLAVALAQHSIELEVYIFNYDSLGQRVITALSHAKQRGVDVRVIIDGVGSIYYGEVVVEAFAREGIECRIFRPLPWQFTLFDNTVQRDGWLAKPLNYLWHINHRDHRKICIIDKQELWSGSLNITQSHLSKANGGDDRVDFGVRVSGQHVCDIAELFERFWNDDCEDTPRQRFRSFLSNHNLRARRNKNQHLISSIRNAEQRVWVCNAYFSPSSDIIEALINAASRGLDVKIIVPRISDFAFFPLLTSNYYKALLETGIEVYEFPKSFLHAKGLLIDQGAIVGSTNLNYRSLFHDLELDVILQHGDTVRKIEASMLGLLDESEKIEHQGRHIRYRWLRKLLYLLRYWM